MNSISIIKQNILSKLHRAVLFAIFISLTYLSLGQSIFSNPEVKATAVIDTNRILVGEQTNIHLKIRVSKALFVQWPLITDTLINHVDVINQSEVDTLPTNQKDIIELSQTITISSFDSGYFAIPPFYFIYGKPTDSIGDIVESNALLLEVNNVKIDLKKEIKDIKPIIDEPWTFREFLPYILTIIGIFLLIVFGIYVYQRRKQNKPLFALPQKPKIPPHILALQKLNTLKGKKMWQTGSSKEFYSELTDILREYMEGSMQFGAMEMVSDDIISELQSKNLNSTLLDDTKIILQTADLVKFAKVEPLADENNRAMNWGFTFVETTKPTEEQKELKMDNKSDVESQKNTEL